MPCVSTDRSPAAAGRWPLNADAVNALDVPLFDTRPFHHGIAGLACPRNGAELPARGDAELDEDLPEVPFDGVRADEQLCTDLLVRQTVSRQARDLRLLGPPDEYEAAYYAHIQAGQPATPQP